MQLRLFGFVFPRDQVALEEEVASADNNYDASIAYKKAYLKNLEEMGHAADRGDSHMYAVFAHQGERNHERWQHYGGY